MSKFYTNYHLSLVFFFALIVIAISIEHFDSAIKSKVLNDWIDYILYFDESNFIFLIFSLDNDDTFQSIGILERVRRAKKGGGGGMKTPCPAATTTTTPCPPAQAPPAAQSCGQYTVNSITQNQAGEYGFVDQHDSWIPINNVLNVLNNNNVAIPVTMNFCDVLNHAVSIGLWGPGSIDE